MSKLFYGEQQVKGSKKRMQPEVFINCLEVLCRANATIAGIDPCLAHDISQAIESLMSSLHAEEPKNKYVQCHENKIVDVLTNEVIYKKS